MASPNDNKTDDGPIKPVSSLRARFEDVLGQKRPFPPPKAPKPAHLSQGITERQRSSLDIPSRTRWTDNEQPLAMNRAPTINSLTKPVPPLDSPHVVATTSVSNSREGRSPPRSPPSLTVQSPGSTRKLLSTPVSNNIGALALATSTMSQEYRKSASMSNSLLQKDLTSYAHNPSSSRDLSRKSSPSGIRNRPPPVNRASKPGTPTTSTFNLEPGLAGADVLDKISPFSTPPSSDESPIQNKVHSDKQAPWDKTSVGVEYFPPPPQHVPLEAKRASLLERQEPGIGMKVRRPDSSASNYPDYRPILPVRAEKAGPPLLPLMPTKGTLRSFESPLQSPRSMSPSNKYVPGPTSNKAAQTAPDLFPPPPKRNLIPGTQLQVVKDSPSRSPATNGSNIPPPALPSRTVKQESRTVNRDYAAADTQLTDLAVNEAPDNSQANRRPPKTKCESSRVWTQYDARMLELCGNYVCTGGIVFRAWNITNARMITDYAPEIKELRVTAFIFKPGGKPEEEGLFVWLGNNAGEIQEIDLKRQLVLEARREAHGRREVIKMFRHQNSIWSLDDEGKLLLWPAGKDGCPDLRASPNVHRLARGHSCSIIVKDYLWIAHGRQIHVYNPLAGEKGLNLLSHPLSQSAAAEITCCATISNQLDHVYFGHSDGKISIYSITNFSCLSVISASPYKINCLAGTGSHLWAGFNTGMINVYDTLTKPWTIKKEWQAHQKFPVSSIVVDSTSLWKFGHLQVASLGADNAVYFWDGMLEDDWIETDMQQHDVEFCSFQEISAAVMTWNAGASTPSSLRYEQKDTNFFREAIRMDIAPDLLVFGFQELVDLEDKKLTAKAIFKGSRKKDASEADHESYQYRAWRDCLTQMIQESMPQRDIYTLLQTSSMVGLFSCVFVKSHLRNRIRNLKTAEVKRGLGGLHGNKGAIILRFVMEDTSLCFANCHLAAGQSQVAGRNADITAILDATIFPEEKNAESRLNNYTCGGDGAMIMDHEICIINGDLNYRIDTMSRDTIVKAIKSSNLTKLLERDQLIVTKRRNPGMRLRAFHEEAIRFVPTYKYDVGTDRFDTSEKARSPAWCDRILYRGLGRVKQLDYQRHELKLSDHRPVSALFMLRLKSIDAQCRAETWKQSEARLAQVKDTLAKEIKLSYFINVLGIQEREARKMLA